MSKPVSVSFSLPLWGRAGVGAPGLHDRRTSSTARALTPTLSPGGEGVLPCPLSRVRERARVRVLGLNHRHALTTARRPHPDLPPEGEGAKP